MGFMGGGNKCRRENIHILEHRVELKNTLRSDIKEFYKRVPVF